MRSTANVHAENSIVSDESLDMIATFERVVVMGSSAFRWGCVWVVRVLKRVQQRPRSQRKRTALEPAEHDGERASDCWSSKRSKLEDATCVFQKMMMILHETSCVGTSCYVLLSEFLMLKCYGVVLDILRLKSLLAFRNDSEYSTTVLKCTMQLRRFCSDRVEKP